MKKFKVSLASLAAIIGIVSALAFTPKLSSTSFDDVYNWNVDGQNHTVADARVIFSCPQGDNQLCATGSLVSGSGPLTFQLKKP